MARLSTFAAACPIQLGRLHDLERAAEKEEGVCVCVCMFVRACGPAAQKPEEPLNPSSSMYTGILQYPQGMVGAFQVIRSGGILVVDLHGVKKTPTHPPTHTHNTTHTYTTLT